MSIYLGNIEPKKYFVGDKEAKSVWIGSTKVWEKSSGGLVIDGLSYRIAEMPDGRIWMCENCQAEQGSAVFYCNDESTYGRNGKNYGRLYNWNDAMSISNRVDGWHLPTTGEWDALANAVGGSGGAGTKLKANSGWSSGNGSDDFGFSVFPAGSRWSGSFGNLGGYAYFWTASAGSSYAYYRSFSAGASMFSDSNDKTSYAYSVRLVKDS